MMRRIGTVLAASVALVLMSSASAREGEDKGPRPSRTGGEITKVDASSISILQKKEGAAGQEQTYRIDQNTRIMVQSDEMETVEGEGGTKKQQPKWIEGRIEDLKAGQRVGITHLNGVAQKIELPKPPPPKVGREGGEGRKDGGEAKPPRKSEGERERDGAPTPDKPRRKGGEGER